MGDMNTRVSLPLFSTTVAILLIALLLGAAREAQSRDPAPALPDSTDTRAWWQSRLDLLRLGMSFEEVRALLPPWGGSEGGAGGGSGMAWTWRVSPSWIVQVGFAHSGGCFGRGRLIAVDEVEAARPERIARIVRRRSYAEPAQLLEGGAKGRPTRWHVESEIEVYADGRYRWTQVSHSAEKDPIRQGTLPEALTAGLEEALGVASTPLQIEETEAGPKDSVPAPVAAVLAHIEAEHEKQLAETR
jgi:hypothetical protein